MPRIARLFINNACHHLVVRGSQGKPVFVDNNDYLYYLKQIHKYKVKYKCLIYAYCLMDNHVHIVAEFPWGVRSMSKFMHCLNQSYAMKFNKKYAKSGHLWQNRYKNFVVLKNNYLLNLLAYVEHNPVRAKIVSNSEEYHWSSYRYRVMGDNNILLDDITL